MRGVIFDSLNNRPLAGAAVVISGSVRSSTTDVRGRFDIDSIAIGEHILSFSSAALDSLGLFGLGRSIQVVADRQAVISLSTPSFATVWRALCPKIATPKRDSAIVHGEVIIAENDQRVSGARVELSWWSLESEGKMIGLDRLVMTAFTNESGNYFACGVPADAQLTVEVQAGPMASGTTVLQVGEARVARRDYLVSAELTTRVDSVTRDSPRAAASVSPLRGTSVLRGFVHGPNGAAIANALVTVIGADTSARSGADGRFLLGRLPAGTQSVRVLRIGRAPATAQVDLRQNRTTDVEFDLSSAKVLKTIKVFADRTINFARQGFDDRKRSGLGSYIDAKTLDGQWSVAEALRRVPSVSVSEEGPDTRVLIGRGIVFCAPSIFLDGRRASPEEMSFFRPSDLYGVEVYTYSMTVPPQFTSPGVCGAIAIWTKSARW